MKKKSALDWRDSFLTRLEMHTGERWTWKKIDGELCLGEGKSSATFWRALRVGIQSSAHAAHQNVLVVKPANATQKVITVDSCDFFFHAFLQDAVRPVRASRASSQLGDPCSRKVYSFELCAS